MSRSLLLILLSTPFIHAKHAHNQRQHRHVARQDNGPVSLQPIYTEEPSPIETFPSIVLPPPTEITPTDISEIADDLDSCFDRIPADLTALMAAIDQRLQDVQSQVSSILTPGPPNFALPSFPAFTRGSAYVISTPEPSSIDTGIVYPLPASFNLPIESATPGLPPALATPTTPLVSPTPPSVSPSLCVPIGGAGPLVPCNGPLSTTTTHMTTTHTVDTTVTYHIPVPNITLSHANISGIFPTPINATTLTALVSSTPVSIFPTPSPFNADARDNLAVYFGNTPATKAGGLTTLCQSPDTNIIILTFIYDFFSQNNYPSVWFGQGSCSGQTPSQAANAPGLSACPALASEISQCQQANKKVLISLGGAIANSSFTSDLEARRFAVTLWNLFGAGSGDDSTLRPFGSVVVDGFDIDNEDGSTAHWDTFVSAMKMLFTSDESKQYYISAAPQCPYPDASNSITTLQQLDFVWVQFYNNPSCNLDSDGFQASFQQWSAALTVGATSPQLFIGVPAFAAAGSGYVNYSSLSSSISLAKELFVFNFGGIMLWDGSEALLNGDPYGHSFLDYAKWALEY